MERTLSILKPDITVRNLTGEVNALIEASDLRIIAQKRIVMSKELAAKFYDEHRERPFFGELVEFISSAPVVLQVLEGNNAISHYRKVMGATNPSEAEEGTIRRKFALSIGENSVHGSDSAESAAREIGLFFSDNEIVG